MNQNSLEKFSIQQQNKKRDKNTSGKILLITKCFVTFTLVSEWV